MDETSSFLMERAGKIVRRSIYTFLKYFQYFSTTPVLLLVPFSASVLLSQALFQSSFSFFHAARISLSLQFVSCFNLNVSQTIFSFVFILPFALSSLVIAKASIIQTLNHKKPCLLLPFSSSISLYKPLLLTQLYNLVLINTLNTAALSLLFVAYNYFKTFGFSTNNPLFSLLAGAVFFALITNTNVLCNLALVVAGMKNCTGHMAIYKAYMLKRCRNSVVLLLALPTNLGLATIEALFRYRVVRSYNLIGRPSASLALEGLLIAYLYSLLVALDTVSCCLFIKSCESNFETEQADGYCYYIQVVEEEDSSNSVNYS